MTSNEQEAMLQSYGRLPAREEISGSNYAKQHPLFQAFVEAFVDQGPVGRARATVPQWDQIENTILACG
jgi:hypothetical protein